MDRFVKMYNYSLPCSQLAIAKSIYVVYNRLNREQTCVCSVLLIYSYNTQIVDTAYILLEVISKYFKNSLCIYLYLAVLKYYY